MRELQEQMFLVSARTPAAEGGYAPRTQWVICSPLNHVSQVVLIHAHADTNYKLNILGNAR
jgi:hypothetical protein